MMEIINPKTIGALVGLIVGIVLIFVGPLEAFLLALLVFAGWVVGKLVSGEIDLLGFLESFLASRGRGPRA